MGMYTELVLKCRIKEDIPAEVESVLNYLFGDGPVPAELPLHKVFQTTRWRSIGRGSSYYHIPFSLSKYSEHYLFSRSDLKDYDDEIAKFVNWLIPYVDAESGVCIGWSWYEEDDTPTLLEMPG